ncbi:Small subunit (SSU) processome component, partial [Tulasnella sp. 403]
MLIDADEPTIRRTKRAEYRNEPAYTSSYSPDGRQFAYLSLAVDKHRLRVYNTTTGKSKAEYVVEKQRVTAMSWLDVNNDFVDAKKVGKKRKTQHDNQGDAALISVVALGTSEGTVLFFCPTRNQVIYTLPQPTSSSSVLAIASSAPSQDPKNTILWTSNQDGIIRAWSLQTGSVVGTWQDPDRTPFTSISLRPQPPNDSQDSTHLIAGHHNIRLFTLQPTTSPESTDIQRPTVLSSFAGHASPVTAFEWDPTYPTSSPSRRFVSIAENDRIVQIWQLSSREESSKGKLVATLPLDSDVRHISLSSKSYTSTSQVLLALSSTGIVSVLPIHKKLASSKSKTKVETLVAECTAAVAPDEEGGETRSSIIAAQFLETMPGHINITRIVAMRPIFETIRYMDENGNFIPIVSVKDDISAHLPSAIQDTGVPRPRYSEKDAIVTSGLQPAQDPAMDNEPQGDNGELDTELAELSLGERLQAITARPMINGTDTAHESGDEELPKMEDSPQSALTVTRTITQALHSKDHVLLTQCLGTGDEGLIIATVRSLRQDLAVPLLNDLFERLGKGRGGRSGGAHTQQATIFVKWIRAILIAHSSHLVTVRAYSSPTAERTNTPPQRDDLVPRLAELHATLATRAALQNSFQTLSGRLDL